LLLWWQRNLFLSFVHCSLPTVQLLQRNHHSLEGEFSCCMAVGSLLSSYPLVYCWICQNLQQQSPPEMRIHISTVSLALIPRIAEGEDANSTCPKPASSIAATNQIVEIQSVWVWSSTSVSARIECGIVCENECEICEAWRHN
jgi:hypothetical protein